MNYYQFVNENLQNELANVDYYNGLRRRRNQHENHDAKFNSNCAGCRAAYWMKKLQEYEENEAINETKPTSVPIGLVNVIKTESTPGSTAVKTENSN